MAKGNRKNHPNKINFSDVFTKQQLSKLNIYSKYNSDANMARLINHNVHHVTRYRREVLGCLREYKDRVKRTCNVPKPAVSRIDLQVELDAIVSFGYTGVMADSAKARISYLESYLNGFD